MPPVHEAVELGTLQTWPHMPQLFGSAPVFFSQPLATMPSQSWKPGLHVPTAHMPFTQAGVPLAIMHLVPQPPQLFGSFCVLISQPSAGCMSQSLKPGLHMPIAHMPLLHAGVALGVTQTWPQLPQ